MPPLVAALAVYIGTIAATIVVYGAVVITIASVAYSAYMMATMEKPSNQSDAANRTQTVRSSVQPHRVIYGEIMTSGVLVYAQSHSIDPFTNTTVAGDNVFISLVIAICSHEIESIDEVWLNDKISTDSIFTKTIPAQPEEGYYETDENGYVWVVTKAAVPEQIKSYVTITKYLGTSTQTADPFLVSLPHKPTSIITKNPDSGLNDFSIVNASDGSGTFSGVGMAVFTIRITATGTNDTFHWNEDKYAGDGTTLINVASGTVNITGNSQLLADGISVKFDAVTGHSIAQTWEIKTFDGAPWTTDCTLTNRAYVVVTLEKHNESFPNGLPNVRCLVKGNNKIYDPRTATSSYSKNWTLCVRDYLKKPYGLNVPDSDINDDITISTANICDENVTLADGSTQKRYVLNGSFTVDKTPTAIMNEILLCAFGAITWTQGKYRILPAAYYTPDPTFHGINVDILGLTESDLKGSLKVRPTPSMKDKFNTIKGTYISPETWQEVDFPKISNSLYKSQDGGIEIVKDVKFTYITNAAMAQRVAKIILEKSRQSINIDFPAKWSAFPLTVGSNVPISISHLGFVGKIFTVRDWKLQPEGGVELTLQEDALGCYEWNSGEETTVDLAQNTVLEDPRIVPVPLLNKVGEELYVSNVDSIVKSRAILTWNNLNLSQYEVNYISPTNTIWAQLPLTTDTTLTIDDISPGMHSFRVRGMNFLGIWGNWGSLTQDLLGKTAPLSNVTGFTAAFVSGQIHFTWQHIADDDRDYYEIRQGADWATAVVIRTGEQGNSCDWRPAGSGGYTFQIRAKDTSGNWSAGSATATIIIAAPDVPTAIACTGVLFGIDLAITYNLSRTDTAWCEIWAATTNDRNTAVQVGVTHDGRWSHQGLGNAAVRYYWARTVNIFGETSAWYPSNATGGAQGTTIADPTAVIQLLNADVTDADATKYLTGQTSLLSILDTRNMLFEMGVVGPGVACTYTEALAQASSEMNKNKTLLSTLNSMVSGLITSNYVANETYVTGEFVTGSDNKIYQAKIDVPINTPPPNATYWQLTSDLVSIVNTVQQNLDTATGAWTSTATALTASLDALTNASTGRVTVAESAITQQGGKISLIGNAITGPLCFVAGVVEPGVAVQSAADIVGLDVRVSQTRIVTDTQTATISLQASLIETLTGRVSQAEIDIDGANAVISLKASQASLDSLTNVVNTKAAQIDLDAANAAISLRATSVALSGQVDILSDMIGLKLNATGTVGPGLAISWTDETHTRSIITVLSNTFCVAQPDGGGSKQVFTVGSINGASAVGVSGDLLVDGAVSARTVGANQVITNSANIADAIIKNSHIGNAEIEAAKIKSLSADLVMATNFVAQTANIAAAAIKTAQIDNLQISTLKIAGEAVTMPRSYIGDTYTLNTTDQIIGSITIPASDSAGKAMITGVVYIYGTATAGTLANIYVYINGVQVDIMGMSGTGTTGPKPFFGSLDVGVEAFTAYVTVSSNTALTARTKFFIQKIMR